MIKSTKIRLLPTKKQENTLWKSVSIARFSYVCDTSRCILMNWALDKQIKHFESTGKLNKIPDGTLRKEFTQLKQQNDFKWLFDVSNDIPKQAIKDLCSAIDRFHQESKKYGYRYRLSAIKSGRELTFRDFEDFPRFKSRKKSKLSFYNDLIKLKFKDKKFNISKVGWVKSSESNRIPKNPKFINPRVSFDNKYWYISVGFMIKNNETELSGEKIGIDLGIKHLAIVSNIKKPFKTINKSLDIRKLKKRKKRLQRKVSRKYLINKDGKKFVKTKNIIKLEIILKLLERKLKNIRNNHLHQTTNTIVKTKPSIVVMEDLNIKGMMKNKHLSKAISEQKFHEFIRQMKYKCEFNGIEFIQADRWFPSSKTCSCCGEVKKDLKLSDRIFKCKCGYEIDRDKNASINLSRYELA